MRMADYSGEQTGMAGCYLDSIPAESSSDSGRRGLFQQADYHLEVRLMVILMVMVIDDGDW